LPSTPAPVRTRRDRCPGVFRPWPAADGALVRLRLAGGLLPSASLTGLMEVARTYGDGDVHLTGRANLQLRGMPTVGEVQDDRLDDAVVDAIEATGLLPSRSHELVRNLMVSPGTGLAGGRADLRALVAELDQLLCSDPGLARLPGRFLFVLDDGRGDLVDRPTDLGLVALSDDEGQVRLGSDGWGAVVPLEGAGAVLVDLAWSFLSARGQGDSAPWHVDELGELFAPLTAPDPRLPEPTAPLAYGVGPAGDHVEVPDGRITPGIAERLVSSGAELIVTPWHGVLVPTDVTGTAS
jgi:precorrin-3B synthase